ncbi:MAG: thioredoxin family protein [Blastopirellula sp. JB062]
MKIILLFCVSAIATTAISPAGAQAEESPQTYAAAILAYAAAGQSVPRPVEPEIPDPETPVPDASPERQTIDYRTAYLRYQRQRRPMVVMVTARWCPHCPAVKRDLLKRQQAGEFDGASLTIVDHDQHRATARGVLGGRRTLPALSVYYHDQGQAKEARPKTTDEIRSILAAAARKRPPRDRRQFTPTASPAN